MPASPRRIIVLGSTGSIGANTLHVIEHLNRETPGSFEVVGLASGTNADAMLEQAARFGVRHVALANGHSVQPPARINLLNGPNAAQRLVESVEHDLVVAAIVGSAGLSAVVAAIERGSDIALANKETLVAAGEIVMPLVRRRGVRLIPVDSEHSAIFQCLEGRRIAPGLPGEAVRSEAGDESTIASQRAARDVKRIILTASGGPFRTWSRERIRNATVEQALNHPTWNMGAKITIDSATMMNKALEIIEAHWLFGLESDRIEVIVHPQSIAHSFVEFVDGSILAQLGTPDMRTPIQYALTWPHRRPGCSEPLDWSTLSRLDFEPPDEDRFPALRLAREVIERGGTAGAIFNAANEAAVAAFLDRRIPFGAINDLAAAALNEVPTGPIASLDDIFAADAHARRFVANELANGG